MIKLPIQARLDFGRNKGEENLSNEVPIDKFFPEEVANELATLEAYNKHLFRPNTYLHKWWARRSGTTFRHILKQLVCNPDKREFYEPGGLEGKVILDPMMGGGTTLHEAIRMGANVVGIDIDPIPVLQTRASLCHNLLRHKKAIFNQFFKTLKNRLASFYQTSCSICGNQSEVQFVLYGLRRKCSCREVVFIDSLLLRESNDHNVHICFRCSGVYIGKSHSCQGEGDRPLLTKGTRYCQKCGGAFADIADEAFPERYVPLAIAASCNIHGGFFKTIDGLDLDLMAKSTICSKLSGTTHIFLPRTRLSVSSAQN